MTYPPETPIAVSCACGAVEMAFSGPPIVGSSCYCGDCRTAGAALEALPGAPPVLGPDGGTDYLLYRNDRYRIVRGADQLAPHRLKPDSPSRRMVAQCCNTALFLGFDGGPHWISAYRLRFPQPAPAIEMRLNTSAAPDPDAIPSDVPAYKSFPLRFVFRLLAARLAMVLGR